MRTNKSFKEKIYESPENIPTHYNSSSNINKQYSSPYNISNQKSQNLKNIKDYEQLKSDKLIHSEIINQNFSKFETKNYSEYIPCNIEFELEEGNSIPFIHINENSQLILNQDLKQIFQKNKGNVGFVSIIGVYGTGKSFLLNKLLNLKENKGFNVNPNSIATTKGIWIYTTPIFIEKENTYLYFLDFQGFNDNDSFSIFDEKLFILSILLSSHLLFNSIGLLENKSLSSLKTLTTLKDNILVNFETQDISLLSNYMPQLLWILRDTDIPFPDSNLILEKILINYENDDELEIIEIKNCFINLFKERQCIGLSTPLNDGNQINSGFIPKYKFNKKFFNDLNLIKEKILYKPCHKNINGVILNDRTFFYYITNCINNINESKVINLENILQDIIENECSFSFESAMELYFNLKNNLGFQNKKIKNNLFYEKLNQIRNDSIILYLQNSLVYENKFEFFEFFLNKLKYEINENERQIIESQNENSKFFFKEEIENSSKKIYSNLTKNAYSNENLDQFLTDFREMATRINNYPNINDNSPLFYLMEDILMKTISSISFSFHHHYGKSINELNSLKNQLNFKEKNQYSSQQELDIEKDKLNNKVSKLERNIHEKNDQHLKFKAHYENLVEENEKLRTTLLEKNNLITQKDNQIRALQTELNNQNKKNIKKKSTGCFKASSKSEEKLKNDNEKRKN